MEFKNLCRVTCPDCGEKIHSKHMKPGFLNPLYFYQEEFGSISLKGMTLPERSKFKAKLDEYADSINIFQRNYYGGRVSCFMKAVCDCGNEFVTYMQPAKDGHGGYEIFDMAFLKRVEKLDAEVKEEVNPEGKTVPPDIDGLSRDKLIALAKKLQVQGKIYTFTSQMLKDEIQKKLGQEDKVDG